MSLYPQDETTFLDEYVNNDDGWFTYEELPEYGYEGDGYTMYLYNMTSQQWMDGTDDIMSYL